MTPEQQLRAEELFLRLADQPDAERLAALRTLDEDTAVLVEVRSLLGHHTGDSRRNKVNHSCGKLSAKRSMSVRSMWSRESSLIAVPHEAFGVCLQ